MLLYEGLGFTGAIPLLLAGAYVTVACCGNFINSLLVDRVGRTRLLRESLMVDLITKSSNTQ